MLQRSCVCVQPTASNASVSVKCMPTRCGSGLRRSIGPCRASSATSRFNDNALALRNACMAALRVMPNADRAGTNPFVGSGRLNTASCDGFLPFALADSGELICCFVRTMGRSSEKDTADGGVAFHSRRLCWGAGPLWRGLLTEPLICRAKTQATRSSRSSMVAPSAAFPRLAATA